MNSKISFKIKGMCCAEEVAVIRKVIEPLQGLQELAFDILNSKMTVTYDSQKLSSQSFVDAVKTTGMLAESWEYSQVKQAPLSFWAQNERLILTSISGTLIALGFSVHSVSSGLKIAVSESESSLPIFVKLLYALAALSGVWLVLPKAWYSLKRRMPDMNLLMTLAVAGAVGINQWFEAASVAFLFALSILLEAWSVGRARRAVAALMALTPPKARVLQLNPDQEGMFLEKMLNVGEVKVGARLLVKPGEKFPLDGKILLGSTSVNQAPITGESVPVEKMVGSDVFAGTINGEGAVEFESTKTSDNTTVAKIIHLVGEAQSRRSPSEQWVEKFAKIYTPTVMMFALGIMLLPPLLAGGEWARWFYEGLVLLVIACPCALVISTPVSIVAAMASAAKNGVLIKGGLYVEVPAKIRAVALDKTGTLTEGRPEVREVFPMSGHSINEVLEIAAAIESQSEHPLARAVLVHAKKLGLSPKPASDFKIIPGKGATAKLDGKFVWIGSHRLLEERGQETPEMHLKLEAMSIGGSSVVVIGNGEHVCGFIAVADKIRTTAKNAIAELIQLGIDPVVMLTGDNQGTANSIGAAAGVSTIRAELLPEDKLRVIEELVKTYQQVAMIGDGVNDAPAMARSSLGIAMGVAGTDAAIETADIALMSDDLSKIPWLIRHSKRTLRIIRQNITVSLLVKAIFVTLALWGHSSLWAAIAADMGISLLVVLNALRLLKV